MKKNVLLALIFALCCSLAPVPAKAQEQPPLSPSRVLCELKPELTVLCVWVWGTIALLGWATADDPTPQPTSKYELQADRPHEIRVLPTGGCGTDCYIVRLTYDMDSDRCRDMFAVDVFYLNALDSSRTGWVRSVNQVSVGLETHVDIRVIAGSDQGARLLESYRQAVFVCQVLDIA